MRVVERKSKTITQNVMEDLIGIYNYKIRAPPGNRTRALITMEHIWVLFRVPAFEPLYLILSAVQV